VAALCILTLVMFAALGIKNTLLWWLYFTITVTVVLTTGFIIQAVGL